MTKYIEKCDKTNYSIEYIIDDEKKIAHMHIINSDFTKIKEFIDLLKKSCDHLKENNITTITQYTSCDDWKNFLENKTTWTLLYNSTEKNFCHIQCPIDNFLENIAIGLGL